MSKIKNLRLRTISLILTFAMIMGCVCNTAAAETGSKYVEHHNGNSVERVYDSGNVILSNRVEADKRNNAFTIKLNVKVANIAKLPSQADSVFSEDGDIKDSSASGSKSDLVHTPISLRMAAPQQEEFLYEVRFYTKPNFKVVESSIPKNAVLEEDGQYVSWHNLTARDIENFSVDIQIQPVTTEDVSDESIEDQEDKSGVYQNGEPVYLFAQLRTAQLPPITAKTAKLNDWDARTYNINLSVTAQSQIQTSKTPGDIILVLDRSGSMDWHIYTPKNNPTKGNSYYIHMNNYDYSDASYQEVSYHQYDFWDFRHHSGWYYKDNDDDWKRVYPSAGGTGYHGYYQFHTKSSQTKLESLKAAANQFVTNVAENSSDSRIGVVSFASNAAINTYSNGKQLLRVGNGTSETEIRRAVDSLTAGGATAADYSMETAKYLFDSTSRYESVTTASPRNKVIVYFTDGEPNHYNGFDPTVAIAAIQNANFLKTAPYNASVYSIGVFSGLSGSDLTRVESFMKDVASYKPDSVTEKQYYPASDADALSDIFKTISNEAGGLSGAIVTDVIDPRFELTLDSKNELTSSGASIINNTNGTQTIIWSNQKISVKKDPQGNLIPDWIREFTVKAKDQFIGGNAIPTNVEASSGVTYGNGLLEKFPHPTVNVKPVFYVGNAETTIFYGEPVLTNTLGKYVVEGNPDIFCGKPATGTFSYKWFKSDGTTQIGSEEAFPVGQLPDDDTHYTLKVLFTPKAASDESTANSDGSVAQPVQNTVNEENSAQGKYVVNVVKGELNITKTIDKKYPAPACVDAKQSFVFKIERRDEQGRLQDAFYEVITMPAAESVTKRITGLKKGLYTVTEETSDAWRYTQKSVSDNDDTINAVGSVFIGRDTTPQDGTQKSYFGAGENKHGITVNPAIVRFTNSLAKQQWLGDTTVAVNTIHHAS